jgi:hypothetical protein
MLDDVIPALLMRSQSLSYVTKTPQERARKIRMVLPPANP